MHLCKTIIKGFYSSTFTSSSPNNDIPMVIFLIFKAFILALQDFYCTTAVFTERYQQCYKSTCRYSSKCSLRQLPSKMKDVVSEKIIRTFSLGSGLCKVLISIIFNCLTQELPILNSSVEMIYSLQNQIPCFNVEVAQVMHM